LLQLAVRTNKAAAEAAQSDEVRAALEAAEQRTDKVKARLELLQKRIPDDIDMDDFLREINEVATQNKALIVNVRPGEVRERDSYRQAPVAVDATGRFKNIYSFVNALRDMPRLTTIDGIDIAVDKERLCRTSLTMSIYAYRDNRDEIQE
jgi:Tfp pilus assembly protein PilO